MADDREPGGSDRRSPMARFRCQVCARFVTATMYGVCPRCGLGPPNAPTISSAEPDPIAWRAARRRARELGIGQRYWIGAAIISIALALLASLAVIG